MAVTVSISLLFQIVSLDAIYSGWSSWICSDNTNHNATDMVGIPLVNKDYVMQNFIVYEQPNFGVVNFGISQTLPFYVNWTTNNFNGNFHLIPINNIVKGIQVKEQSGYGIVDIRFLFDDNTYSPWSCNNPNGNYRSINTSNEISQIQGMQQEGYGIVNLRIYT